MRYTIGKDDFYDSEVVRTVDNVHSAFEGFCELKNDYPDCSITDRFYVVRKYKSDEDSSGNCYDWYLIKDRIRTIDRSKDTQRRVDNLLIAVLGGKHEG